MPTIPTGRATEIVEVPPAACANGHPLRPPNVQVTWQGCSCAPPGHRAYRCWACGAIAYDPPHTADTQLGGLERGS
jgi:hypothetical protein